MSIFATLSTVMSLVKNYDNVDKVKDIVADTILDASGSKPMDLYKANGNIVKLVNSLSVEPIIITTEAARRSPAYKSSVNMMLDIFSGYYLQAFQIMTELHGLDARLAISLLNNRNNSYISKQNYLSDLLNTESFLISKESDSKTKFLDNDIRSWYEQRTLEVSIDVKDSNGKSMVVTIPVIIRAQVLETDIKSIMNFMQPTTTHDKSFLARFREWRSGGISLMDLIFVQDLRAEYRKNKIQDKDDMLAIINNRSKSSYAKQITSGIKGFEGLYNMLLIHESDTRELNNFIKGDVSKPKFKEDLLKAASSILYCSLDDDYERAAFFITDTQLETVVPFKKLDKKAGKSSSDDMIEIVKAILAGRPMTF
jgi:hypothetical protein